MSEFTSLIARREVPSGPIAQAPRPEVENHSGSTDTRSPAENVAVATAATRGSKGRRWRRRTHDGTLASVAVRQRAVITGISDHLDACAARRLVDLGFAPGATVEVLRRAPLADPTVFRVADTEIALRRHHAAAIRVDAVRSRDDR